MPRVLSIDRRGVLLPVVALLAACVSHAPAPISAKRAAPAPGVSVTQPAVTTPSFSPRSPPTHHVVARGDTLHGVAWKYRLDFRDIVKWNNLSDPDLILVGQRLRLTAPAVSAKAVKRTVPIAAASPAKVPSQSPPPPREVRWGWPAVGETQSSTSVSGAKGLEIRGNKGQPVKAAAGGEVVYSGSGLLGYGQLIIIKHDDTFLSAYAHNDALLVKEGRSVRMGEAIALMGNSDAKDVMLHFEIRRNGKAVDPLKYLPRK